MRTHRARKSLSSESTYAEDLADLHDMLAELDKQAAGVARGLAKRDLSACTVTIKVRYSDFTTVTRSQTLPVPTRDEAAIAGCARELLSRTQAGSRPVRLLGVGASNLLAGRVEQLSLFGGC